jgi:hypothetical protein
MLAFPGFFKVQGGPGLAGTLATAIKPSTAGKPVTAGPPATVCSKGTTEVPTRPGTGNHQELKGREQATAVTQAVTPAKSNSKDYSNMMTAHNSRHASNSRNESN